MTNELDQPPSQVLKILVAGPFASGKSTLIRSISQTPVVETDVDTTGIESIVEQRTTAAIDFGTFTPDGGDLRVVLFGVPGRQRFGFMTEIMMGGVDAVIYVVDAEAPHTHLEAGRALRSLVRELRVPLVIAVNRCGDHATAASFARQLGALASEPALPCRLSDANSAGEVVSECVTAIRHAAPDARPDRSGLLRRLADAAPAA